MGCTASKVKGILKHIPVLDDALKGILDDLDKTEPDPVMVETEKGNYPGKCRALFIGINYIGQKGELGGCINDVKTMKNILRHRGVPFQADYRVLVEDTGFDGYYAQPTRANIEDSLRWLVSGAAPGDVFFLHYSGHGTSVRDRTGDETDGMDEALVPLDYQDAGMILDDDIYKMCVKTLPTGARLTAVLDCCHSGTLMDLQYMAGDRDVAMTWNDGADTDIDGIADVVMFSGCRDEQTSADVGDTSAAFDVPQTGQGAAGGACSNAMAETIHGLKASITFHDLLHTMRSKLDRRGFSQIPQLSSTKAIPLDREFTFYGRLD